MIQLAISYAVSKQLDNGTATKPYTTPQQSSLQPGLQAADGSYFGTMQADDQGWLTAFNSNGDVRWRKAGDYQPLIATADGGVIARLAASNGLFRVMLDASGNVLSQVADDGQVQSWTGNSYSYESSSLVSKLVLPVNSALSFAAASGGNGTAVQKELRHDICSELCSDRKDLWSSWPIPDHVSDYF